MDSMAVATPAGVLGGIASYCYRRRRVVVLLWLVGAATVMVVGFRFAATPDDSFEQGGTSDSAIAQQLVNDHFPAQKGDRLTLAVHAEPGIADPEVRARVESFVVHIKSSLAVTEVATPYITPGQISPDGRTAFAVFITDRPAFPEDDVGTLISDARAASGDGVTFALEGKAVLAIEAPDGGPSALFGIGAALFVMLISFGSLLATGLPMVTSALAVGAGLAVIGLVGHIVPGPSFGPVVATLLGLGIGVDYALFIVTRFREELAAGASPETATVRAMTTSGRAVLFAGATVVVGMLGLFVIQQRLLNAAALAAAVTVVMTIAAATTLLPSLLGFVGGNIDRLRLPVLGRTGTHSPMAQRWAQAVQRRPTAALVIGTVVMLALAAPALSMRLSDDDSTSGPRDSMGYLAHRMLADSFGEGYDAPLVVVAETTSGASELVPIADAVRATPGIASVTPVYVAADAAAALVIAYPTTSLHDPATPELVRTLRDGVISATANASGVDVHIGGPNAGIIDFAEAVQTRLPWLIGLVSGVSLLVLLVLIRSVVIAVKAALLTLLSVAASYGALTAIVQWGWLDNALGFPQPLPITAWVPLLMFPILFGLSTDYEVFVVSRIREEYDCLGRTSDAVTQGLARSARVVTTAAAIMVTVFLAFLITPGVAVKEFGLGLAIGVFLDATIVRMILVPAAMGLLGSANWWLPDWLDRALPGKAVNRPKVPPAVDGECAAHGDASGRLRSNSPTPSTDFRHS